MPGRKPDLTPASQEEVNRVNVVAQKLLGSNRESGLRPRMYTIGAPMPELFHRGTDGLYITEALSRKCRTEGQLAAVLAYEMGRMVAEREALADPATRRPDRLPPQESRVGMDSGGAFGPPDGTRQFELAKYDRERPKPGAAPPAPPDPLVLARAYLEKAGYSAKDLEDAASLLKEARASCALERQMISGETARPWTQ